MRFKINSEEDLYNTLNLLTIGTTFTVETDDSILIAKKIDDDTITSDYVGERTITDFVKNHLNLYLGKEIIVH